MTTFIFVHGSFHGAWNWHKVIPEIERTGHRAVALDMPAHGTDPTPAAAVTLDSCVRVVTATVEKCEGLVVVLSQAAEKFPDRISRLIYIAAYLVPGGKSFCPAGRVGSIALTRNPAFWKYK